MSNCRILSPKDREEALELLNSETFKPFREKFGRSAEHLFFSYVKNWLDIYYPEGDSIEVRTDYKLPTEEQLLTHFIRTVKLDHLKNLVNPNKISYYNIWYANNEHAELSNFANRSFTYKALNGDEYEVTSVEQAFQLEKLLSLTAWYEKDRFDELEELKDQILNTKDPDKVKELGRRVPMTDLDKAYWEIKKEGIMKEIIKQSLIQNPEVLRTLLSINKPITHFNENNEFPKFWGTRFPKILDELKEELKGSDYVDVTNFESVKSDKVVVKPFKKPWKTDPSKVNDTMRIYLKDNPNKGYFEVVKDEEGNYYSVHFKPEDKTNPKAFSDEEKEILFQAVADMIPYGAYLSTWGELTKGGIAGLNRFGDLGFTEVERRDVKIKGQTTFSTSRGTNYPQRTRENADWSDITLALATDFNTRGEKLTKRVAGDKYISSPLPSDANSDYLPYDNEAAYEFYAKQIYEELKKKGKTSNIKLNIAGNGIYSLKGFATQEELNDYVTNLLKSLQNLGITISEIRSGGQTGVDEAGIVAAQRLNITNEVHSTSDFKFRDVNGRDISDETQFKARFQTPRITSDITIPVWQKTFDNNDSIIRENEKFYTRADVMDNPDILYIFTDNTDRTSGGNEIDDGWYAQKYGKGGYGSVQNPTSAIIRGLPNAAPISTMKWFYKLHEGISFDEARWHDEEFDEFKKVIDAEIEDIKKLWREGNFKGIILPKGGLTSRLEVGKRDRRFAALNINRVPKLYTYLNKKMAELSEYVNDSSSAEKFEDTIGTINEENWHKVDAVFTSTKKRKRVTLINKLFSKKVEEAQKNLIDELEEQLAKATSTRDQLNLAKAIKNMTPFVAIKQEQPINLYDRVQQIFKDYIECAKDPEGFKELVEAELEASVGTFLDKFPEAVKRKMTENKVKYSVKEYQLMIDNWDELIQDAAGTYGDTYSIYIDLAKNMVHEEFTEDNTNDEGYNKDKEQEDNIEETPYKDGWMQDVRELSVAESMTNKVRNSINDIERVDRNGNVVVDDLGYAQTLQASYVFTEILSALKNMTTSSEMIPMLEKLQSRKPWASQIVNAIKNDDQLFTAYYRVFRKDFMNMWIQRVTTLPEGTIQIKTVNINKPSGTAHYFDEWRDNFEYGVVLDKEDSIYNENGEIRKEKAKVGLDIVNSLLEKFREARTSDKDKEKENIQKVILENTVSINKLLNMVGIAITPESLKELLEYNVNYDNIKLLPGQIVLNQLSIIFKNIPNNDAIKDGEPADLLNLYGSAFNKIAMAINNIDEDDVESSTRQGKKTLYAHTRPSYLTTLIKKLKGPKAESFIESEYEPVNFLHDKKFGWYNTLIADLREDPTAREKLEHMVLLEYNRKEYGQWTPLDTFLALFSQYNAEPMDAKSKEGYAWYQVPLLSDAESAEFIRAKRIKTNYEEVLLKKFVNVVRQEYNRIVTVKQRYNNKSIEKIAGYDMANNFSGGAKFFFFPELNTEVFSKDNKSFFERLAEVADDTEAFEKLAMDAILEIMNMNFANAVAGWASIGVFDRVDPNNNTSAFKYFKQRSRERIENVLREYYWNSTYMQSQIIQLLTTDLAYYKDYENFTKRALEFHSPTEKLNTLAKWEGEYVLADKNGNVRPARAISLSDEVKPSKWTPEIEEIIDSKIAEGKLTKYDKTVILGLWNKIEVTDAQAMRTFKSFRATQIAGDMWDDDCEKAYNNIRSGNWTAKDFVVLWNTRKPYLYTQKNQPDGVGGTMRKALQHKNSEIVMLTQAVFGSILHQSNKFRALSEFMEEHDIDVAMFGTAIKVGGQGFIDINNETSATDIKKKLEARYLKNGEINTDTVEEYNWEDYGFQTATPEHNINAIQLFGTQIRRLISADLDPNTIFTVGNKKFTLEQWLNYYNLINTANIREAFEKLDPIYKDPKKISELIIKEIKKNSRYSNDLIEAVTYKDGKFNIPIYDLTTSQRLQELLNSIIKSRIIKQKVKGGALIQATPWLLDEKDKPQIVWGTDKNGKKYIKYMEAYIACPDDSLYDLLIEPDGSINIDKKDSKGRYIVPEKYRRAIGYRIPTEYKYSMIPIRVKGFLPRQVGSVIILPEEITCTTGSDYDVDKIYMMYHSIRVRDTYNIKRAWDDFYKSHPEIVQKIKDSQDWNFNRALEETLKENPDLDADIEELKEIFLKGHKQYEWDSSVQPAFTKWFNEVKDKYNLNQRKVEIVEYNYGNTTPESNIKEVYEQAKKNSKAQRDSMIIDLMFSSLTTYETVDQMINPGGFEEQKRNARICTLLDNMSSEEVSKLGEGKSDQERFNNGINKILNLSLKEVESLLDSHKKFYNPLTPDTWVTFQQRNMSGASLVPMAATQNASHALTQHTKEFRLEDKYVYTFNGEKLKMLNRVTDVTGHYITKNVGSYLAAFVDNAKDAIAGDLNINTTTANLLFLLIRLGNKPITASLVLKQPAVDMILKYVNTGKYSLNEAIEQAIQDCANSRTSKNTGATKDQDFTDTWLAKNIVARHNAGDIHSKFIEEDEFYNNQMKVLVMLKGLFKAAEGLGNVVRAIRFDTQTGGPGGSIAQGLEKIDAVLDILNNKDFPLTGIDFIWEFIGGSDSEEYVIGANFPIQTAFFKWGLDKTLDWYKGIFPHVGPLFQDTINTIKEYTTYKKINGDTENKIFNQFVLYLMSLVSKDFTGDIATRSYYINDFPKEFAEFKAKENYLVSQLPLLKRIQYRGSNKYNGSSLLVFNNVGKVTDLQAREYRSDFRYLLLNDKTRDMALKLLKYNYYRGLGFSPQGFSTFIPSLLKMDTGTDYVESLEKILELGTDDQLIYVFIDQYIRNNLSDRTFVPEVSYSGIFREEPPESFKVAVTKASSLELKKFIYNNDSDTISYRHYVCYTYKGLPHYYKHLGQGNYSAINPLGDTYYREYDASNPLIESVIKKAERKNFDYKSDYRAAQIEEQFKDALGGLDSFASAIGNNIPTFDDIPYNPEDAVGKSKRTIDDTSAIEGMLSRFDKFDFSSLNSPKIEEPTSTSTSADDLSPEEEAKFAKFDMSALEAAAAALKSIDPSGKDLDGNKNCKRIE